MVENTESGQSQTVDVYEPFVLIGRAPGCHLQLMHPEVCFRHAYCQVIQGRLYVFDLDSRHGIEWGTGLRREGVLTPDSRLQIGPFDIRLSRAPAFTRSLEPAADTWELANEPLEDVRLWFENAVCSGSQTLMRPLRRQITILGRSNRCHLKLSDPSVSKAHCSIVRTGMGYWLVDLLGRTGTHFNDQPVRFVPLGPADQARAGRFRFRIRELVAQSAEPLHSGHAAAADLDDAESSESLPVTGPAVSLAGPISPMDEAAVRQQLAQAQERLLMNTRHLPAESLGNVPGASDALILAMMEQFSHLQQQLLTHTQQQMSMLTEMFATLHKAQNEAVMQQLNRIQEISSELNSLRAERAASAATPGTAEKAPTSANATAPSEPRAVATAEATVVGDVVPVVEAAPAPGDHLAPLEHGEAMHEPEPECDVVPVDQALCSESEVEAMQAEEVSTEDAADSLNDAATESQTPRYQRAPMPRFDATAHARLTMRIGELERERNSRWRRLLQLVGGGSSER